MYEGFAAFGVIAFGSLVAILVFMAGMAFDRYISRFTSWEEFKNDFFN